MGNINKPALPPLVGKTDMLPSRRFIWVDSRSSLRLGSLSLRLGSLRLGRLWLGRLWLSSMGSLRMGRTMFRNILLVRRARRIGRHLKQST